MSRRLFALDHNFPEPVLATLATAIPMAELVPVRSIGEGMSDLDDWQLLAALNRDPRPWDGLITNDEAILSLPKEMTVLSQTHLSLVVVKGEGHSPVRATGVLLCHLAHICHHTTREHAQIWRLRVAQKNPLFVGSGVAGSCKDSGVMV
jgi:hypothetical protein